MKKILLSFIAVLLTSCYHMPDQDILSAANQHCESTKEYYSDILRCYENDKSFFLKTTDKEFISHAKLIGQDYYPTSFWSIFGPQYTDSCPMHRAVSRISNDLSTTEKHLYNLEKRVLVSKPVYDKLMNLKRSLLEIRRLIRSKDEYVEEAKFIEKTNIAKSQLYEQQKQTRLLEEAAAQPKVTAKLEENNYNIKVVNY
ncbi:hypothetical protein M1446_05810 [Candidatus Dependentiae bacterium]|nr:hypothetical protein [Candidatus Dependentiae bacterium]